MKRTYKPNNLTRKRKYGFLNRKNNYRSMHIINNRRRKGRKYLTC